MKTTVRERTGETMAEDNPKEILERGRQKCEVIARKFKEGTATIKEIEHLADIGDIVGVDNSDALAYLLITGRTVTVCPGDIPNIID